MNVGETQILCPYQSIRVDQLKDGEGVNWVVTRRQAGKDVEMLKKWTLSATL